MPTSPPELLSRILRSNTDSPAPSTRPHVTLTFAQSLDARIAGAGGRQLILSGRESMVMTHWMRTMHDGILVGIGTALNDDPQLNVRQLPPPPADSPYSLPRPIIIDPQLQLSPSCKLLKNYQSKTGRMPWVLCREHPDPDAGTASRKQALQAAGARVVEVPHTGSETLPTRLQVEAVLQILRDLGIKSLMVEGGARVITSFLSEDVVDTLIITVAPVMVGDTGIGYQYPTAVDGRPRFKDPQTEIVGQDSVVCLLANKP
ncbi:hypothetical protein D9619_002576 [Psilocybe cf. subviscida]|uniref:2,5-diamino-6-ribosylamino-4(3H)-pyrimidinone 5'-phosphate reductase n=1 Tax=Psilocybe cf. subviscida TaxID=2480587 RepID=A0A8H5EUE7_9AGAR|nr:hypothetical protein D9619_002576 [Psilocybe cf. subviscida]